jgi:hypothetical protein
MSLTVTAVDNETGTAETWVVDNDHLVITHGTNAVSAVQRFKTGTTQYTIKVSKGE